MTTQADDLQAVRVLVEALEPFNNEDRLRIIRWAGEKLGIPSEKLGEISSFGRPTISVPTSTPTGVSNASPRASQSMNIKSFVENKSPKSDRQLAAVVAYFYAFEAPESEKKDSIDKNDLIDACRKAGKNRPTNPAQTLRNAQFAGYLDKASDRGMYKINSVGENLVAMVLPGGNSSGKVTLTSAKKKKRQTASNKSPSKPQKKHGKKK